MYLSKVEERGGAKIPTRLSPSSLLVYRIETRRFDRAVKEQDLFHTALVQSREQFSLDEKSYQITIIEDLISNVKLLNLSGKWIVWSSDNMSLHFVKPSITDHLISIRCSLTVTETLQIIGVYEGTKLTLSRSKIKNLREVDSLLKLINNPCYLTRYQDSPTAGQRSHTLR